MTWQHRDGGYLLLCNRDEKRSRKPALGPRNLTQDGVRFIAPRDGDSGGSWISTNEFGVSLCLLNAYPDDSSQYREADAGAPYLSRGLLLLDLAAYWSTNAVARAISSEDLHDYSSFTLLALAPSSPALVMGWNGKTLKIDRNADYRVPLTSSSVGNAAAATARTRDFFERGAYMPTADIATLLGFHASHNPTKGAHSACMHRDDAETVSLSMVSVGTGATHFWYHPVSPCQDARLESARLLRDKAPRRADQRTSQTTYRCNPLAAAHAGPTPVALAAGLAPRS